MANKFDGYETVAASQTAQALGGGAGAASDYLSHLVIFPASTSPGAVTLLDGATSITVFPGGTESVPDTRPFTVALLTYSASGRWAVTTGAAVSVMAVGSFSV